MNLFKLISPFAFILLFFLSSTLFGDDTVQEKMKWSNQQLLTELHVIQMHEDTFDGHPALAVVFSQSLDSKRFYNDYLSVYNNHKRIQGGWIFGDNNRTLYFTNIEPNTTYNLRVSTGLVANNGMKLKEASEKIITTRDMKAVATFATKGSVLVPRLVKGLPVRVINTKAIDIEFMRVKQDKLSTLVEKIDFNYTVSRWDLQRIKAISNSVFSSRFDTQAKKNTRTTVMIPVNDIKVLQQPGLYFAIVRKAGDFSSDAHDIMHFTVSDIGLHIRQYKQSIEVIASSIMTGKALDGVALTLQGDKQAFTAITNAQGRATFLQLPKHSLTLRAMKDQELSFVNFRQPALDLSDFKVSGAIDQAMMPFVYSTRNIFRPNESVDLSILLRDRDGEMVALNQLHVSIKSPSNKVLLSRVLKASDLGYFEWQFDLPADAKTGQWQVEVKKHIKASEILTQWVFQVEAFIPERMKLVLNNPKTVLTQRDAFNIDVKGDYLYGAPASGNLFDGRYSIRMNRHPFKQFKDYYFGDPSKKTYKSNVINSVKLDKKGYHQLTIPLPKHASTVLTINFSGSLHEMGGRTVTRSINRPYWSMPALIGIRPLFSDGITASHSKANFELINANPLGQLVEANDLLVTLIHIKHRYYWEYEDRKGWERKDTISSYPVSSQTLTFKKDKPLALSLAVNSGEYRLEIENKTTKAKSSYTFHAGWKGYDDSHSAKPDKVVMTLDKKMYLAGETAKVSLIPPSDGEVIVTVESDHLLWEKRIFVAKKGITLDIPIDKAWNRHDIYIVATALRPTDNEKKIAPKRSIGIIYLPLDRSHRHLKLSIEAKDKIRPEQRITIKVKAEGLSNQKAHVTLAAVDQGVLNITRYKTPDPFQFFFKKRAYAVSHYDIYDRLIKAVDGVIGKQRFGGDSETGSSGGTPPVNNVEVVDLFSRIVSFNEQGEASIELDIPGFDGALRLMAVGFTKDRFGSAEKTIIITSPVVPMLTGPRVLSANDKSRLVLNLNNTSNNEQQVHYKVTHQGAVHLENAEASLSIPAQSQKVVLLPIASVAVEGNADLLLKLTYQYNNDIIKANRSLKFSIRPAWAKSQQTYEHTLNAKGDTYQLPKQWIDAYLAPTVNVDITLSSYPPLNLKSALDGLIAYPYGCLEQTTSRAYPYLYLDRVLAEQIGIKALSNDERNEQVQKAIARISGMQLSNGSFALWDSNGREEFWLTPYVANFLLDAQEQGFKVPAQLGEKALDNLRKRLQEGRHSVASRFRFSEKPLHLDFAVKAFSAYVLARVGKAPLGTLRVLFDKKRQQALSGLPLIHLGLALQLMGDNRRAKIAFKEGLDKDRENAFYLGDYGSYLRDKAMMLQLILTHNVEVDDLLSLVKEVADALHNKTYLSTQEQVFLFLSARVLAAKDDHANWAVRIRYGDEQPTRIQRRGSFTTTVNSDVIKKGLAIQSINDKAIFVSVSVNGYKATAPMTQPTDKIKIQRHYFTMEGKPVEGTNYKGGELYIVALDVEADLAVNDALVSDLLPAGFEIENPRLLDNNDWMDIKLPNYKQSIRNYAYDDYNKVLKYEAFLDDRYIATLALKKKTKVHLFYLVRAVSVGHFTAPPAMVEDMYRVEIRGVGNTFDTLYIIE